MKVLLTGAGGFIGSCFLWKLNTLGIDDAILVDTAASLKDNPNLNGKKFSTAISREDLLKNIDKLDVDVTVHLGACADTTERDKEYLIRNNIEYSKTLAKAALAKNKEFHYASSAAVYGDGKNGYSDADVDNDKYVPLNLYGWSKHEFDKWLISENLQNKVVGYRYFNVFGPNEYHKGEMKSMVAKSYDQILKTGRAKLFATSRTGYPDGSEERDFVYVKDVCDVMAYFLQHKGRYGIFNLGTGQARSFKDLIMAVFSAMQKPVDIQYVPMPDALKGQYQYYTCADIKKLRKAGYNEVFSRLEVSVADYVRHHLMKSSPIL
jgi:ADP-L-glycero-D-manno-heptose 6-epimerase